MMTQEQEEREELAKRIRTFATEGTTYYRDLFIRNDTGPDGQRYGMYEEGDELRPFFTEAFLYNLMGKDEARSVLSIIRRLSNLAGVEYR
jgi:hypothetical protein